MKRKAQPLHAEPSEAEIQHAAYLLWLEAGRPEGCAEAHWFAAKERLSHRTAPQAKPRRRAASTLNGHR